MHQQSQRPGDEAWSARPAEGSRTAGGAPHPAADATLEVPLRLLGRTVKRTHQALAALQPGQVLALHTDDP